MKIKVGKARETVHLVDPAQQCLFSCFIFLSSAPLVAFTFEHLHLSAARMLDLSSK